ncbi:hypothetical protein BGW80DRAFT_1460694 [Lactifluus volemus]|nr:hypothetical protein BGW80DRAFT_1460694 [Lactifluus volemus]
MPFSRLRSLTSTQSTGPTPTIGNVSFDDLSSLGKWPASQLIDRISSLTIFDNGSNIIGIQVTYLVNGTPILKMHGSKDGTVNNVNLGSNDILVGVYGGKGKSGVIEYMSFVTFNAQAGNVNVQGPFGGTAIPHMTFGTFGPIIGFLGTITAAGVLESIGFWSLDVID